MANPRVQEKDKQAATQQIDIPPPARHHRQSTTMWKRGPVLGRGSFGEVIRVTDEKGTARAMKTGIIGDMIIEESVLQAAAEFRQEYAIKHISSIYGSRDVDGGRRSIVMDLFGSDLKQLLRRINSDRFENSTAIRLGVQAAESVRELHELGFVHRDLKPSNWVVGIGRLHRQLFVVDFGLARRFWRNDRYERERAPPSFIGTVRYASIHVHQGIEASQRDDGESWYYSLIEWFFGPSSWMNFRNKEEVLTEKLKRFPKKVDEMDDVFADIFDNICERAIGDDIDWPMYIRHLKQYAKESKLRLTGRFEWEVGELLEPQIAQSPVVSLETTTTLAEADSMSSTAIEEAAVEHP